MVVLSSFCLPESPVKQEQQNIKVFLDKKDFGAGTLYISERLGYVLYQIIIILLLYFITELYVGKDRVKLDSH